LAKIKNDNEDQIDLTSFTFLSERLGQYDSKFDPSESYRRPCGTCHPGGGILELDREGKRYDKRLLKYPSLAKELNGDYFQSKWDQTGVIEADCFICHLQNYNYLDRREQIRMLNFKWSSVAGAGIGQINGYVAKGDRPKVQYNKRLFNENGKIFLAMNRKTNTRNCLFCHFSIDKAKRGTVFNDPINSHPKINDVHNIAGLKCIDCHFGDIDHNFAKGDDNHSKVRDDLDNTMKSCEDCHTEGYKGAPRMKHQAIRNDHLDKLSCQACHIPFVSQVPVGGTINITGEALKSLNLLNNKVGKNEIKWEQVFRPDKAIFWQPIYEKRKKGKDNESKIWPVNRILPTFFTNKDADGLHYQLFTSETKEAYEAFCKKAKVEMVTSKKQIELKQIIYKPADIKMMLQFLTESLENSKRFEQINLFYHKGGNIYFLDKEGKLSKERDITWVGTLPPYSISHNVAPAKKALGVNGCNDCHSKESRIFNAPVVTDLIGENGETLSVKSGIFIGYNPTTIIMSHLYGKFINIIPFFLMLVFLLLLFLMLQYGYGTPVNIQNIEWLSEHRSYLLRISITLLVLFLGHIFIFMESGMINVFFSLYKKATIYAGMEGLVLFVFGIITFFLWTKNVRFTINKNSWIDRFIPDDDRVLSSKLINISALFVTISGIVLLINLKYKLDASIVLTTSIIHGLAAIGMLIFLLFNIVLKLCEDNS